jgi:site-specific recombinase XerD
MVSGTSKDLKTTRDQFDLAQFRGFTITLYRRCDVGNDLWVCRFYVKAWNKYHRKTLPTEIKEEAIPLAQHELIRVLTQMESGQRPTSHTIAKAIQEFSKLIDLELSNQEISKATHKNTTHRIQLAKRFLALKLEDRGGIQCKVSSLDGSIFENYIYWRKDSNPDIRRDVVHQELLIIKRMFRWVVEKKKWATDKIIPTWSFKVEKEKAKRARIGITDCWNVLNLALDWSEEDTTDKQHYARELMAYVLIVINCSGLRTGECLNMKYSDVIRTYDEYLCEVEILATNTKRKQTRTITIGGMLSGPEKLPRNINFLLKWMNMTGRMTYYEGKPVNYDYVFCDYDGSHVENLFYHTWGDFKEQVLNNNNLSHFDPYHQRHGFISDRIRANANLKMLADHCGTSIRMISQTYSQILGLESSREMLARPFFLK